MEKAKSGGLKIRENEGSVGTMAHQACRCMRELSNTPSIDDEFYQANKDEDTQREISKRLRNCTPLKFKILHFELHRGCINLTNSNFIFTQQHPYWI